MALNIKDPEAVALAAELAARLHTSKTGAIRHALRTQLADLDADRDGARRCRTDELLSFLRAEIWPITASATPISKAEREQILGYTADGV